MCLSRHINKSRVVFFLYIYEIDGGIYSPQYLLVNIGNREIRRIPWVKVIALRELKNQVGERISSGDLRRLYYSWRKQYFNCQYNIIIRTVLLEKLYVTIIPCNIIA